MILVCATDSRFADLAGPFLRSVAANGDIADAEIVVLADRLTDRDKDWLARSASGLRVRFVDVDSRARSAAEKAAPWYISGATYLRLLLPDLLPEVSGRVLYLDVDMIVNGSLRALFDMPLDGHCIAAVQNAGDQDWPRSVNRKFGREPDAPNINAGLLVVDLDRWRDLDVTARCFEVLQWAPDVGFGDQDAINAILGDDVKLIDRSWNFWSLYRGAYSAEEYAAARVVHFVSWQKPNLVECRHPARELYLAHRAHTPWADVPLMTRQPTRLRRLALRLFLKLYDRNRPLRVANAGDLRAAPSMIELDEN